MSTAKPLVSDGPSERIEPVFPAGAGHRYPGRKRVPDRQALTGILFVSKTGIPREDLPQETGCGSGMTWWRRLRDWTTPVSGAATPASGSVSLPGHAARNAKPNVRTPPSLER